MKWDLTNLYSGMNDPKIDSDKNKIIKLSKSFEKKYRNHINSKSLEPEFFYQAILDYEDISNKLYVYASFASLLKSQNMLSEKRAKFNQEAEEFSQKIDSRLIFFELEITAITENKMRTLLKNPKLKIYKNYIDHIRTFKKYRLTEREENILRKKNQTSTTAFIRLYDEISSDLKFELDVKGKKKKLNYAELTPYMSTHIDRDVRNKASESLTATLSKNVKVFSYILNTLVYDKELNDNIRDYDSPEEATYLGYQIEQDVVEKMSKTITEGNKICEKFYKHKSKLLKIKKLDETDRYSNIYDLKTKSYTFKEAKTIILEAFAEFSPIFHDIALKFFENKWIDSDINKGKAGGAFCSFSVPDKNPYILVNFTGKFSDITILAHELGHGIHGYLSQKQPLLVSWSSIVIAEIASVFCEAIVFNKLIKSEKNPKLHINLLANKIQNLFATVFRQNSFFIFEKELHKTRRKEGELSADRIGELFQSTMQNMFGSGLKLNDRHKFWWIPIQHFFHYNFYVFSYTFGESLALALLGRYIEFGQGFIDDYIEALTTGSSLNPLELTKKMNIDIHKGDFWKSGLSIIDSYVEEFIKLSSKL